MHLTAWKPTGWAFTVRRVCTLGLDILCAAYTVNLRPTNLRASCPRRTDSEGHKFDATFDNWCGTDVDMIVTLAYGAHEVIRPLATSDGAR